MNPLSMGPDMNPRSAAEREPESGPDKRGTGWSATEEKEVELSKADAAVGAASRRAVDSGVEALALTAAPEIDLNMAVSSEL